MNNIAETKPIITSATVVALVSAIIALLIAFGVPISDEQKIAVLGVASILIPMLGFWWSSRKTTALADPKITVEDGTVTSLIRADTGRATPQAIKQGNVA